MRIILIISFLFSVAQAQFINGWRHTSYACNSGTTCSNNGTLVGSHSWASSVPSVFSACTYSNTFSGGKLTTTSDITLPATGSTISIWFKKNVGSADNIFASHTGFSGFPYIRTESAVGISIQFNSGGYKSYTVPTMTNGTWYNLIIVRGASDSTRVYLDGVQSTTGAQLATLDLNINQFGVYFDDTLTGLRWAGGMTEIAWWGSTALGATDISNIQSNITTTVTPTGKWKMHEGTGTAIQCYTN